MLGSSTCGPGCESQHGDAMVGRWQSGPHTLRTVKDHKSTSETELQLQMKVDQNQIYCQISIKVTAQKRNDQLHRCLCLL